MTDKRVLLGRCGAAHGIRGEVRVKPYTDTWDGLGEYGPLELEDGSRHLTIERMRQDNLFLPAHLLYYHFPQSVV